ncbi:MAG: hypothetical protein BV458_01490 [Thermoplasmata archaeon M9B2D]|nr:MAG: hypothetical protein BV458_01490 [Thermoplasmata archaeon M9B2D]
MKKGYGNARNVCKRTTCFVWCIVCCLLIITVPFFQVVISEQGRYISGSNRGIVEREGWEVVQSGVTQDLNSIFFICINRGSVVGDGGIILSSGDGGNSWTVEDSGVTTRLYDVFYFGYFVTVAVGANGTILFSNNTGQNWTVKQTGMMGTYFSGQMISDIIGVAVGVNAISQPLFTRTNDGWNTWQSTSFYIEHETVLYEGRLTDVFFMNESVGFATAIIDNPVGGAIVRTTTGGSLWETIFFTDTRLLGIDFTEEGIGYVVGEQGVILQTLDEGQSWQHLDSGVNSMLQAIDFFSETKGTIVGENGVILRTENAGLSWVQQTSGTTCNLQSIQFITELIGFAVGEQGLILRTTTGGFPEDTTPPQTNCTLSGVLDGDVYISDVAVSLSAIDDFSGVATTMFNLDDGLWTAYDDPFDVSSDGSHTLRFYSIDNAGNIEDEKTCQFTILHPLNLTITLTGGLGITVCIFNPSLIDLRNVSWAILLDSGFVLFGKQKSGEIDIKAGREVTLRMCVFGFGRPTIILTVGTTQKIVQSSIFLCFVRI